MSTPSFSSSESSLEPVFKGAGESPSLRIYTGDDSTIKGEDFRSLFQRRYEYARLLLELSTKQQMLIAEAQYSGLIELLLKKQTVIDALQALSQTDPPLLEQWRNTRDSIPENLHRECERLLAVSEEILAELLELEQQCTSEMQKKQGTTRAQLEAVSNTINVQDAYHQESLSSQFDQSQ